MSARASMKHRCVIQRNYHAFEDTWDSQAFPADWQQIPGTVPCYWWSDQRTAIVGGELVSVGVSKMLLPLGTDITEADRVTLVTDRRAQTIHAGVMLVDAIERRRDHLAVTLREVD